MNGGVVASDLHRDDCVGDGRYELRLARLACYQAKSACTSIDPSNSEAAELHRIEAVYSSAALGRAATLLRAIHLELIPACRAANFIGTAFRPLAPTSHPAIATLLAAVRLPDHGPEHSQNILECQFRALSIDYYIEDDKWFSEASIERSPLGTSAALLYQVRLLYSSCF